MNPPDKTRANALPQVRPPPISQHLREFVSNPHAWGVLARNLIPVVGIYFFQWSAALTVFNYWFDGFTALAAIITALVPRALRETRNKSDGVIKVIFGGLLTWVVLVGIIGLPYWIVLIPLQPLLQGSDLKHQLMTTPGLWFAFGSLAAGHFWKAFQVGYDVMPDKMLTQRVRWDVYLLILRALVMFMMMAHGLYFIIVPLMALVLTYFEIWPERVLGMVFGDPSRLWEYDPQEKRGPRGKLP